MQRKWIDPNRHLSYWKFLDCFPRFLSSFLHVHCYHFRFQRNSTLLEITNETFAQKYKENCQNARSREPFGHLFLNLSSIWFDQPDKPIFARLRNSRVIDVSLARRTWTLRSKSTTTTIWNKPVDGKNEKNGRTCSRTKGQSWRIPWQFVNCRLQPDARRSRGHSCSFRTWLATGSLASRRVCELFEKLRRRSKAPTESRDIISTMCCVCRFLPTRHFTPQLL